MKEKKYSKKYLIETATGLQKVDNLSNSKYFIDLKNKYVSGKIDVKELSSFLSKYYKAKEGTAADQYKEADIVSSRITDILSDDNFTFSPEGYLAIHRRLFEGIFKHAGEIRTKNLAKEEWVLNGDTVRYGDYRELSQTLRYDLEQERHFNYKALNQDEIIQHLAIFISNLWQNHVFWEGNTRTTAIFLIKYLRSLGYDVANNIFAEYSLFFRNALVRANYKDLKRGIYEDNSFLISFLRNLILNEKHPLHNRNIHIDNVLNKKQTTLTNNQELILKYVSVNPKITIRELAIKINVSEKTVKNCLAVLKQKNILVRKGARKLGSWEVLNEKGN